MKYALSDMKLCVADNSFMTVTVCMFISLAGHDRGDLNQGFLKPNINNEQYFFNNLSRKVQQNDIFAPFKFV